MALIGNTIKLRTDFYDWYGNPVEPDNVVVRIYNRKRQQIGEDTPLQPVGGLEIGRFEYDCVLEEEPAGTMYFEFSGTIEGKPVTNRIAVQKRWTR